MPKSLRSVPKPSAKNQARPPCSPLTNKFFGKSWGLIFESCPHFYECRKSAGSPTFCRKFAGTSCCRKFDWMPLSCRKFDAYPLQDPKNKGTLRILLYEQLKLFFLVPTSCAADAPAVRRSAYASGPWGARTKRGTPTASPRRLSWPGASSPSSPRS